MPSKYATTSNVHHDENVHYDDTRWTRVHHTHSERGSVMYDFLGINSIGKYTCTVRDINGKICL